MNQSKAPLHITIMEAKIYEPQDQLNKLNESLKLQNDKPIDEKEDEIDKVIQRKKQVCKDNDQFLVKNNIVEGFFNGAKSFDPQNEKIIQYLVKTVKKNKKLNEIIAQMHENSNNSLKEKNTQIEQLKASLKRMNDEYKKYINELNKSQKEKEDLSKTNDKNINEINKLIENLKYFELINKKLMTSLDDEIKNKEKLEQSIKQLKDYIINSTKEKCKINNDLEDFLKQLREENEKLKKEPKRSSEEYKNILEGKIKETKEQLNKLLESLKNKDDNYKPIQDQDELAKIIDFLERKKQVTKENDDILIKRHELIGFFKCAISFDQINTKIIEEKYIEFNIFYSNLINSVQNLKIMATDLNLDEYLNLARTKKVKINKTIASLQQEIQKISSENKKLTKNLNEMKKNIENLKNREKSQILNVSEKSDKKETKDSFF